MAVVFIPLVLILCTGILVLGDNNFNYEISAHVVDIVANQLYMVSMAGSLPLEIINQGNVNISLPYQAAPQLFYPSMIHYKGKITNFYIAMETGLFYLYGHQTSESKNIYFDATHKIANGKYEAWRYNVNPKTGYISTQMNYSVIYDPRVRPWYKTGMAARQPIWSAPYLDLFTRYPLISFMAPIVNQTLGNTFYKYAGLVCADLYLTDITNFLTTAYGNTDRKVFIVDKLTGNLIGNSWGADTSVQTSWGPDFLVASQSNDRIISGATKLLQAAGFPLRLVIFQNYYLQSTLYEDTTSGLVWYIIVLLPAVLFEDHLGPGNPLYRAVLSLSSLSLVVSVLGIGLTLWFWKYRIVRLSQPFFTVLVLTGGLMLSIACFFLVGDNDAFHCTIRPYFMNLAFTFSFSPLLIKSWRVHMLFNVNPMARKALIPNEVLLLYTIGFVLIDLLLGTVTLYGTGDDGTRPVSVTQLTSNGAYTEVVTCGAVSNKIFFGMVVGYKGLLVIIACYLSFKTRNVQDAIAGSKVLLVIVYNTALIASIMLITINVLTDIPQLLLTICICITIYVLLNTFLMVVPWLSKIMLVGDEEAANLVLEGMTSTNANTNYNASQSRRNLQSSLSVSAMAGPVLHPSAAKVAVTSTTNPDLMRIASPPPLPFTKPRGGGNREQLERIYSVEIPSGENKSSKDRVKSFSKEVGTSSVPELMASSPAPASLAADVSEDAEPQAAAAIDHDVIEVKSDDGK